MRKPTPNIDYTSRDYEAFRVLLLEELVKRMPEYTDVNSNDAGVVILECLANGLDIISMYADIIANDLIFETTQSRIIATSKAKTFGYIPFSHTASKYRQVFVLTSPQNTDTIIPRGTVVKTQEDEDLVTLLFETEEDLVIPKNKLGNEKGDDSEYLYSVLVSAGKSIKQDIVGSSSGAPLQQFKANFLGVILDTLEVFVDDGSGEERWERVDSFFGYDINSKVYTAMVDEYDQCIIQFGNGINGKIPKKLPNNISLSYKIGGGEISNVNTNVINTLESSIPFVASTFNAKMVERGRDKESLESIKINAPASNRTRDRIITLDDFRDMLRLHFYDFLDIKAIRDTNNKRLAHLYYVMRSGYTFSPELKAKIDKFIPLKLFIGGEYDIQAFLPENINITCNVYIDKDYDGEKIKGFITSYIKQAIFNPDYLMFGDSIVKSDVESEIKKAFSGVLSCRITAPTEDIIKPSAENKILRVGTVSVNITKI